MSVFKRNNLKWLGVLSALGSLFLVPGVHAAKVEVEWVEPTKFTDVMPSNESRKRFREQTLEQLTSFLVELGEQLPDSQILSFKVTNLDLAGQVWPTSFVGLGYSGGDIRVIRQLDIPRITFSYTLTEQGKVISEQKDVKLKDMGFMQSAPRSALREPLVYEKAMLEEWFDDTFSSAYVNNQ
jgi:hypothetical protein